MIRRWVSTIPRQDTRTTPINPSVNTTVAAAARNSVTSATDCRSVGAQPPNIRSTTRNQAASAERTGFGPAVGRRGAGTLLVAASRRVA